ncbi:hypothetical protein ACOSQ2_019542 [Xanthoceras sorbifolium]
MGPAKVLNWGLSSVSYELVSSARKLRDFKESNSTLEREIDTLKLAEAKAEAKAREAERVSRAKVNKLQQSVVELETADAKLRRIHKEEEGAMVMTTVDDAQTKNTEAHRAVEG